jgi:hypothetical protein
MKCTSSFENELKNNTSFLGPDGPTPTVKIKLSKLLVGN